MADPACIPLSSSPSSPNRIGGGHGDTCLRFVGPERFRVRGVIGSDKPQPPRGQQEQHQPQPTRREAEAAWLPPPAPWEWRGEPACGDSHGAPSSAPPSLSPGACCCCRGCQLTLGRPRQSPDPTRPPQAPALREPGPCPGLEHPGVRMQGWGWGWALTGSPHPTPQMRTAYMHASCAHQAGMEEVLSW